MNGPMTETILAAEEGGAAIHVGHHTMVFEMFGMTFNGDTIMATAITAVIVIGLAFFLKSKVTSTGVPGGVQLFWEALTIQMRQQIEGSIGMRVAPFVLPLAFMFLSLITGTIQAYIFAVLAIVYIGGAVKVVEKHKGKETVQ